LLLEKFRGTEEVSGLFRFDLDMLAESQTSVPFEKLLGQAVTVTMALPGPGQRFFHGIVSRLTQGHLFQTNQGGELVRYRAEMVPHLWLLTRRAQCRVFQQLAVPDILKQVLTGLDVSYQFQGSYEKRDYCVQYRETDFDFVSRLMEQEGIYYYFKHEDGATVPGMAATSRAAPSLAPRARRYSSGSAFSPSSATA
jgi:type VI secretion system secreted protein VgrG